MMEDRDLILLERYKKAIELHTSHDNILWQQSSIFLLAEITIIGFGLTINIDSIIIWALKQILISGAGLILAGLWYFVNIRRQRFMATLEEIKNDAAHQFDEHFHFQIPLSIDVDHEVHEKRIRPGMRALVVWILPVTFLIIFAVYFLSFIPLLLMQFLFHFYMLR